jgi:hypothetical protein
VNRHTPVDLCACDVVGWIDASSSGAIFASAAVQLVFRNGRPVPIEQAAAEPKIH